MSELVGSKLESDFDGATKLPCYTASPGSGSTGPVRLAALPNDCAASPPPPQRTDNEKFDDETLSLSLSHCMCDTNEESTRCPVALSLPLIDSIVSFSLSRLHFSLYSRMANYFRAKFGSIFMPMANRPKTSLNHTAKANWLARVVR